MTVSEAGVAHYSPARTSTGERSPGQAMSAGRPRSGTPVIPMLLGVAELLDKQWLKRSYQNDLGRL